MEMEMEMSQQSNTPPNEDLATLIQFCGNKYIKQIYKYTYTNKTQSILFINKNAVFYSVTD